MRSDPRGARRTRMSMAACLLAAGCAANEAIEEGTACDETCPVGAQRVSAKEATGSCSANGSYDPAGGAAEGGGSCVGEGACQVVCLYPQCAADQTLVISATEFRCEAGGNPCVEGACSGHGRCRNENGAAQCVCDPGYASDGLECVPASDSGVEPETCDCPEGFTCEAGACRRAADGACGWRLPGADVDAVMCRVPAGIYPMGCGAGASACEAESQPGVNVQLSTDLLVDRTEVTNRRYRAFLTAQPLIPVPVCPDGGEASPWDADGRSVPGEWLDHPVVCVTAEQAEAFCRFAGKDLPTEAQWEAAARGSDREATWPWGRSFDTDRAQCLHDWAGAYDPASHCADTYAEDTCPMSPAGHDHECRTTAPVVDATGALTHADGASAAGALHLAGNAAEWTADGYTPDHSGCRAGCTDPVEAPSAGGPRVVRGGSWRSGPEALATWARDGVSALEARDDLGFRCAWTTAR